MQGSHAAVAAIWESQAAEHTQTYCHPDSIDRMHKVRSRSINSSLVDATVCLPPMASCLAAHGLARPAVRQTDQEAQLQPAWYKGVQQSWHEPQLSNDSKPALLPQICTSCPNMCQSMSARVLNAVTPQVVLEVKGLAQLQNLAAKLKAAGIAHRAWLEQPELICTALATAPQPRSQLKPHFKKLQLCKW